MALRLIRNVLLCSLVVTSSGCASLSLFGKEEVKPVEIQTKAVDKTPLNIENPSPINTNPIKWLIVTPDNVDEAFASLEGNKVLFAITDDGYQDLSMLMAEIRNFINAQRVIIIKYKEYYEPKAGIQDGVRD
jgi:hypothetical protein